MMFKNILDLRKKINEHRQDLYELERNKGISNLDVIEVKRKLDRDIVMLQKMINNIRS